MTINANYLDYLNKKVVASGGMRNPGTDYLTLTYNGILDFISKPYTNLDGDNSNTGYFDGELYGYNVEHDRKAGSRSYVIRIDLTIDDRPRPFPLCRLMVHKDMRSQKHMKISDYTLSLYGFAWRLIELGYYKHIQAVIKDIFGEKDMTRLAFAQIKRLDYKIDWLSPEELPAPKVNKVISQVRSNASVKHYAIPELSNKEVKEIKKIMRISEDIKAGKKLEPETIVVSSLGDKQITGWSYGNRSSLRAFVRLYDKNTDTLCKGKGMLYQDYLGYVTVRRLEAELGNKFCMKQDGSYYHLNELDEVLDKVKAFMGLSPNVRGSYFYDKSKTVDVSNIAYINGFVSRGYRIYENGCNPIDILSKGLEGRGVSQEYIKEMLSNQIAVIKS